MGKYMDEPNAKKLSEPEIVAAAKDEARRAAARVDDQMYDDAFARAFKDAYLRIKQENS